MIALDASGTVQTSSDAGTTWNATSTATLLPAGTKASVSNADAGPLGFAVLAQTPPDAQGASRTFLAFSTDGVSWTTTDLAADGAPAGGYATDVIVGADHVGVDVESPGTTPDAPAKVTTVLGTPEA